MTANKIGIRRFPFKLILGLTLVVGAATAIFYLFLSKPHDQPKNAPTSAQLGKTAERPSAAQELENLKGHLQTKPEHTPILFRMAELSREMGKATEAAEYLRKILRNEPDNLDARLELGRILYESGNVADAIAETKQLLAKNPRHVDALYNLGAIYANLNNTDLARQYWSQAVASDPKSQSGQNARRGLQQIETPTTSSPQHPLPMDVVSRTTSVSP